MRTVANSKIVNIHSDVMIMSFLVIVYFRLFCCFVVFTLPKHENSYKYRTIATTLLLH